MKALLAVMVMGIIQAQAPKPAPVQATQIQPAGPSQAAPRFQMIQLGEFRADQFLLDAYTGRTWRMVKSSKAEEGQLWEPVAFVGGWGTNFNFPDTDEDMATSIRIKRS
ncbi:MAG: hypothetical protein HY014_08830 [Acidobacteria bacterium]|nr:hypothetical protein [Acidobacteriota bacterium]MBI3488258.1 hypothetical protein [Acidobacteriota bacterium]